MTHSTISPGGSCGGNPIEQAELGMNVEVTEILRVNGRHERSMVAGRPAWDAGDRPSRGQSCGPVSPYRGAPRVGYARASTRAA